MVGSGLGANREALSLAYHLLSRYRDRLSVYPALSGIARRRRVDFPPIEAEYPLACGTAAVLVSRIVRAVARTAGKSRRVGDVGCSLLLRAASHQTANP